jgi:hypothetical protein
LSEIDRKNQEAEMNRVLQAAVMAAILSNQAVTVSAQVLPPAAQLRGSTTVTKQDLAQFIRTAGYSPTDAGNNVYWINVNILGASNKVEVSLSACNCQMWLVANLGRYSDSTQIPHSVYANLLQANQEWAPNYFSILEKNDGQPRYQLSMTRPMNNRGLTPEAFQSELQRFVEAIEKTENQWNRRHWAAR